MADTEEVPEVELPAALRPAAEPTGYVHVT
jgi:hypothetical protein